MRTQKANSKIHGKSKKSLLNAIPPIERKWTAIILLIDAILLCIISYSYLYMESDYKTVEATITNVERFGGRDLGRSKYPAQIRFYTDNGMQFDFFVRGDDNNQIAIKKYEEIKSVLNQSKAVITYSDRENIVALYTLFASVDYKNIVSLEIDDKCLVDKGDFERYNRNSFWFIIVILLFLTLIITGHPIYCVIVAVRKRSKRKQSRSNKQKQ